MSKESDIQRAYIDNLRHNQIGGQVDGISEEVASDIGFSTYEHVKELLSSQVEVEPVASPEEAQRKSEELKGQDASRFTLPPEEAANHNAQLARIRQQLGK